MFYVLFKDNVVVGTTQMYPTTECPIDFNRVETSIDWASFDQVTAIAAKLTELTGKTYLPTDSGHGHYRFGMTQAPMIGDEVSYTFNGDYYPCGKIEKISKTYYITVSGGKVFRRHQKTSSWLHHGWTLIKGHRSEQNPSF